MNNYSTSKRLRRGFSLTETAIVLGVMGIVIGAIWATTSVVRKREPIVDAMMTVTDIASNVRGVYTGFPNAAAPADPVAANLIPPSAVNGGVTINPWGGAYTLVFQGVGGTVGNGVSVQVLLPATLPLDLRTETCVSLATRLTGTAPNYAGGFAGSLPSAALNISQIDGNAPSLIMLNDGGTWENVTASTVSGILASTANCRGVAFYFRL